MNYNFTTADDSVDPEAAVAGSALSGMLDTANNIAQGPMHGSVPASDVLGPACAGGPWVRQRHTGSNVVFSPGGGAGR